VGNTLVNDAESMRITLKDLATWLKRKGIFEDERVFIDTYKGFNRRLHRPHWSHTFGELELFEETLKALGINGVEPSEALSKYRQLLEDRTKPDPDVTEALRFLRERGIKVALLSDERSERIKMFIRRTKIGNLIDATVISEEVSVEKPHPLMFEEVKRKLGVEFPEMIMFGDNETTDGAGKRLGMKFVLVKAYRDPEWNWSQGPAVSPDYVIEKVTRQNIEKCLETLKALEISG